MATGTSLSTLRPPWTVFATALALLLSGCHAQAVNQKLEGGTIVVASGQDVSQGRQRIALINEWNQGHRDDQAQMIELSRVADLQRSQMLAAEQAGSDEYDVLSLDVVWIAEFAQGGYIRPLGDCPSKPGGFLEQPLRSGCYKGRLWALPFNTDAGLLYYRKDVLASEHRGPPRTWDELASMARSIAPAHGLQGYAGQLAPYEGLTVNVMEAIWAAGGEVVDKHGKVAVDAPPPAAGSPASPRACPGPIPSRAGPGRTSSLTP